MSANSPASTSTSMVSPRWDTRNQGFVPPAQLQQLKRDQEHQSQPFSTSEFGQNPPAVLPSSYHPTSPQQQQTMPEVRRTMSGQMGQAAQPPSHSRTTSAFSLFGRKSHTMDTSKVVSPPTSFQKVSGSIAEFPKSHNVLSRRTSNSQPDPTSPNNGQLQQRQPSTPSQPSTSMSPSTPASAKPPPQLHPEIRSIVQLTAAHAQKVYFSGPMIRKVEQQPDGEKPTKEEGWRNVWGQLGGTTLSLWDMKEIEEASKENKQVPPSYINVTDSFVHVIGAITTPGTPQAPSQTFANVFTLNTAGLNLLLFSCPSTQALVSWATALRLAAWEKSRLEEMYTAHLIRIMLPDERARRSPLLRGKMEGWALIRVAGQTDWKKVWMVISAGGVVQDNGSVSSSDNRPTSPQTPRKNRISQLFSREHSPPRSPVLSKPVIQVFTSPKTKDKKKSMLTFRDVAQAFAVYPERPELISRSTLMKLEGVFGDEEMAGSLRNKEAWLLVMPELEANNTNATEMLKWLVAIHDAFELYGRPRNYSWDPRDPQSPMFAYPIGPNRDLLFLDREAGETLDPRDDGTSSVRRQLRQILWQRMRGQVGGLDKAQPPVPIGNHPPTLPPLPVMHEEAEQPVASGSQVTQSPSGAPQISMQIPPLDFERTSDHPPEASSQSPRQPDQTANRPLTPITERSNPPDTRSTSGDTNIPSQRPSLHYNSSPPGPAQSSHSPPAIVPVPAPQKLPEPSHQDQDNSVLGGRVTISPIPTSPSPETRTFGFRPSEEPHFVVASRPASKQGQYGSPKIPAAVPVEPANVELPASPQIDQTNPTVGSQSQPSHPQSQSIQPLSQPQPQPQQKPSSPSPGSPNPPSISHASHASFNPPPPVHSPRAASPSMSVLTSPHSVRDSINPVPVSPRFSMMTSPHSAAPSRVQSYTYTAQHPTSLDTPSSPAASHTDNVPPPSPARSSLASSSLRTNVQRRESRDEPPEDSVLSKEAGALYYMRHIDGDAPPSTGLRRPPPPPISDEDDEDEDSSDSPSIYTPPATGGVNPLNVRKSPSPPMLHSKASSILYPRRGDSVHLDSPVLPTSPNQNLNTTTRIFAPTTPTTPSLSSPRPPDAPSRFGNVAKPSGARAAPGNKMTSAGPPSLASNTRHGEQQQPSAYQPAPAPSSSSSRPSPPPIEYLPEPEGEDDVDEEELMATQNQHSELSYENEPPRATDAAYDDTADALAALNFLEQDSAPAAVSTQRRPGLPSSPQPVPRVVEPASEPLPDSTLQNAQQRSTFAPSRSAAERKAKSQAQQAAHLAAVNKPGRVNGRAKGRAKESGAWGESSDEEEEEEEEDDEDADSDEDLPPRHRAQQNVGAPNAPRGGYPASQSMQSMQMPSPGQDMGAFGQGRRSRDLPQLPGQSPQVGGPDDYLNQPQPRRMMQDRSLYPNDGPRRQTSPLSQMTRPLAENPQYHAPPVPQLPRQDMWSRVLEPGAKVGPQPPRDTFVQIEPPSQTMTKAFTPHGLLSAGLQDKEDRSARRQEELARETGASLINVPNKPPPPQTGLLGAVAAHEREKKREGGLGATLTEREREKRMAEDRQRKLDDYQRMQLDQMQQGGSMYGGMGYPGFNPMMNPMMANPMMMGMNPMMTGGWGGYPGMMNPQQMFAAQQAAQAYQHAMVAFSTAGSQVGGEAGANPAPLNPMMTGGSMFDPRMSMMGMMNPMAMGGMGMGGMTPGMGPGMNPMAMGGGMGMQMTGGASPFNPQLTGGFEGGSGPGTPADGAASTPNPRPYSSQNSSANGRGSPAVQPTTDSRDDLPRAGGP